MESIVSALALKSEHPSSNHRSDTYMMNIIKLPFDIQHEHRTGEFHKLVVYNHLNWYCNEANSHDQINVMEGRLW